ncbi:hypothetical protein J1614_003738 [Plenodomus biglobosus]|nr:hypothetical protein J1614_003738 [Plenodomus biglobosus]
MRNNWRNSHSDYNQSRSDTQPKDLSQDSTEVAKDAPEEFTTVDSDQASSSPEDDVIEPGQESEKDGAATAKEKKKKKKKQQRGKSSDPAHASSSDTKLNLVRFNTYAEGRPMPKAKTLTTAKPGA